MWGIAVGVVGTLLVQHLFLNDGPPYVYRTHIARSARHLLEYASCEGDGHGGYVVSGWVIAPPDTGVLKINAFVNFGTVDQSSTPLNVPGWSAYFDTDDPSYGEQGGNSLYFAVRVDASDVAVSGSARYCWVTAHYLN